MSKENYPFQNFSALTQCGETDKEYADRANHAINSQIRNQILKNQARAAFYTLCFISEGEDAGFDSFSILENLKGFLLALAQEDEIIGKAAEELCEEQYCKNIRKSEKFEETTKPRI